MNTTTTNLVNDIHKYKETLQSLRDEIQVRIHLGTMDVKTTWRELEPHLLEAEQAAKSIATEATRALLTETIKKLIALRARIPH
jgi:hypothetical protein